MRKLISLILTISSLSLIGQTKIDSTEGKTNKYILWVSPTNVDQMHGITINLFPKTGFGDNYQELPLINGIELNINPLGAMILFPYLVHSIDPNTHKLNHDSISCYDNYSFKKVNGIALATLNMEPSIINGIDISIGGSHDSKINGISIGGIINKHIITNGITVGGIANHDLKCNGIQIGLINTCKNLKGFQFGLWNKNQKRSLPLINWAF